MTFPFLLPLPVPFTFCHLSLCLPPYSNISLSLISTRKRIGASWEKKMRVWRQNIILKLGKEIKQGRNLKVEEQDAQEICGKCLLNQLDKNFSGNGLLTNSSTFHWFLFTIFVLWWQIFSCSLAGCLMIFLSMGMKKNKLQTSSCALAGSELLPALVATSVRKSIWSCIYSNRCMWGCSFTVQPACFGRVCAITSS